MFSWDNAELRLLGADITTQEIAQQPKLWEESLAIYKENSGNIADFLGKIFAKHDRVKLIFTGAGTSAYVGNTVLDFVKSQIDERKITAESIPTTSLVASPYNHFKNDMPTILVSYARSGNSPESIAAVELGGQICDDFYQINISCAKDGKLAAGTKGDKSLLVLTPEKSNDQGFAMTGSYTCMTLLTLLIFDKRDISAKEGDVKTAAAMGRDLVARASEIEKITKTDYNRVVYVGSGPFEGVARESQLKILELSAGQISTIFDSPMGLRHGPKSFIDNKSLVFAYMSNNSYTRQYDEDLFKELAGDKIAAKVFAISAANAKNIGGDSFTYKEGGDLIDVYLALPFVMFAQTLAVFTSIKLKNKPDTPSPTGTVNRVVKGVEIYPYMA